MRSSEWRVVAASLIGIALCWAICPLPPALAQFKAATEQKSDDKGPRLDRAVTQRLKVGIVIKATAGPCQDIYATSPIPSDWPEQQVNVVQEEISPLVVDHDDRDTHGGTKQMVIDVPSVPAGQSAPCLVTYEITRRTSLPPTATEGYTIPRKLDRATMLYLGPSPYIETRHAKITALAKELTAHKEHDWQKVEAIFDYVREHVKFVHGELKGSVRALADKSGDSEDLASLFIAICRAAKIPARTVWVLGHCYPEFYLADDAGVGHWFPCQVAGEREFGGISETRAILQKGDNFKDPDRPRDKFRYVSEYLKVGGATAKPEVSFVRQVVGM